MPLNIDTSYYSTGTATVEADGTTVTGQSTAWLQAVRAGDLFGTHVGDPVRIASVDSNTQLTLAYPWKGPAQTESAYEIQFTPYDTGYQAAVRQLLTTLASGNVEALAELTGEYNALPIFLGPGAMGLISKEELVNGVHFDVQVDDLAGRAAYDDRPEGYTVLVADVGDGRSAIYMKNSAATGDWSDPAYITGPVGPLPDVTVGATNTLEPGSSATVTGTPTAGGIELEFGIPEGRGAKYAGEYDPGTTYELDDAVLYNGSTWIALQETTGNAPPVLPTTSNAYWSLLARQGTDGAGTGDVVGPNGGVSDGEMPLFDGATGKLLKASGVVPGGTGLAILGSENAEEAKENLGISDCVFPAVQMKTTLLSSGAEDENIREIGNVFYDPADASFPYKMSYSGHTGAYAENNVYVFGAKSADGLNWVKTGKLVISRSSEDPYIVKSGNTFYLYVEDKEVVPFRNIRLYTATDFDGPWTDMGDVLVYNGASWESGDVSSPVVWKEGATWHMLYEGRRETAPWQSGAIGHATSADGVTWVKDAANPIITGWQTARGPAGWAQWLVPDDIKIYDGSYYLYFHGVHHTPRVDGSGTNRWGCGVLVSDDLIAWRDPLGSSIVSPANDTLMPFTLNGRMYLTGSRGGDGVQLYSPQKTARNSMNALLLPGDAPALPAYTFVNLPMSICYSDTMNGWSATENRWYVNAGGRYRIDVKAYCPAPNASLFSVQALINGTEPYNLGSIPANSGGGVMSGSDTVYLSQGDYVQIRAYSGEAVASGGVWAKLNIDLA